MSSYIYRVVECGSIAENCTVLMCKSSKKGVIFDPGDTPERVIKAVEEMGCTPEVILNTHGHYDHIGAVEKLREHYNIGIKAHKKEADYFVDPDKNFSSYGGRRISFELDGFVKEGDIIKVGELEISVLDTPGHTLGGVCYLVDDLLIAGDTIFAGSIGRSDLYGGNQDTLLDSIALKIAPLPDKTKIIPGHGRTTDVGSEKRFNPFLQI